MRQAETALRRLAAHAAGLVSAAQVMLACARRRLRTRQAAQNLEHASGQVSDWLEEHAGPLHLTVYVREGQSRYVASAVLSEGEREALRGPVAGPAMSQAAGELPAEQRGSVVAESTGPTPCTE